MKYSFDMDAPYPAKLQGVSPITVGKSGVFITPFLNPMGLPIQNPPPVGNTPTDYALAYDSIQKIFFNVPLSYVTIALGQFGFRLRNVNLNAAGDNPIAITFPAGITRWQLANVRISNSTVILNPSTAQVGVFTAPGGGGTALCSAQTISITTLAPDVSGNSNILTTNALATTSFSDATVYFRVTVPQGSPAFVDVNFQAIIL